jgi:hypothetical protein
MNAHPLLASLAILLPCAAAELRAVPTFENCGVYLEKASLAPDQARVRYREHGAAAWTDAHPLVISDDDRAPRGSLFGLKPGTAYDAECLDGAGAVVAATGFTTWSDEVPIARTVHLEDLGAKGGPLLIDQGGTAAGWVRYVAGPGYVTDGGDRDAEAILVQGASFIILEGLTVRGGHRHGIRLADSHDVRVRDCDIAGFGRVGTQDLAKGGKYYDATGAEINYDAGVCVDSSGRLVVERCWIHDPRNHANSWYFSHPAGPTAVFMHTTGEMVVRWNDFIGSDTHRWNDVMEGYGNGKPGGGPNHDSDIYGNYLAYSNDDGIELDGEQCNVRFYGNVIQGSMCGISTAPNLRGPSWVYGNLVANLGDERGLGAAAVKNGGGTTSSKGHTFFYHNTFFGEGNGISNVGFGSDPDRGMFRGTTRNNLFALTGNGILDKYLPPGNSYDHDLFALPWEAPGTSDITGTAEGKGVYAPAGLADPMAGDFSLAAASAARGAGAAIPGFAFLRNDIGASAGGRPLPWRPGDLVATPSTVRFQGLLAAALAKPVEVAISAPGSGEPQPYAIRINSACDWLRVEPASGTFDPAKPLVLRVILDGRIAGHRCSAAGAFVVHLASGASIPVTVLANVAPAALDCAAEAESLEGAAAFTIATDPGASGGKYLEFGGAEGRKLGAKTVIMPFEVPESGWYSISFRLRCPPPIPNHDSLFVGIDDLAAEPSPIAGGQSWQWVNLTSPTGVRIELAKGAHRLRLAPRESLDLDAVQVLACPTPTTARGATLPATAR